MELTRKYDYLIVGAGLFGAVFAQRAVEAGRSVLVLDRRPQIGGNVYTRDVEGIHVHQYGAHIFHTNDRRVWDYVSRFADFNRFTNSPVANYRGEIYSLPFNMYTFNKMWGVVTPEQARAEIDRQKSDCGIGEPRNLEEQAITLVGRDIYEKLVKGYTEKQWGRPCTELPAFIIRRLPVRYTYDNNYFNALFQGIPMGGYTKMVRTMLEGADVLTDTDYLTDKDYFDARSSHVIYTGAMFGSRQNCWIRKTTREMRRSTIRTGKLHGQGSLSTSGSSSGWMMKGKPFRKPLSAGNSARNGSRGMNRTIR